MDNAAAVAVGARVASERHGKKLNTPTQMLRLSTVVRIVILPGRSLLPLEVLLASVPMLLRLWASLLCQPYPCGHPSNSNNNDNNNHHLLHLHHLLVLQCNRLPVRTGDDCMFVCVYCHRRCFTKLWRSAIHQTKSIRKQALRRCDWPRATETLTATETEMVSASEVQSWRGRA